MRKTFSGLLVMVCVTTSVLADEDSLAEVSAKDRATWHLAVHTAARRALEAAEGLQNPGAELLDRMHGSLTSAVLADIPSHSRRDDSLTRCRAAVRELLRAALDGQMARILEVANEQSTLPVELADVMKIAGERYDQVLATALETFEAKHVDALFEKVRSQAVALERQSVDQRISPPPFDTLDPLLISLAGKPGGVLPTDWPKALQARLREDLKSFAGRSDVPVLEEVAAYADGVANRMVDGIRQQYGRQLTIADRQFEDGRTRDVRMAAALEAAVLASLEASLSELPAEDITTGVALPVYPVFATVKNHIRQTSESVEAERFAGFLGKTPLLDIEAGELTQIIQSDLSAHRSGKASRMLLLDSIGTSRRPVVAAAYAGQGPDSEVTKSHFSSLLEGDSQPPATVFKARLADGLDAQLPAVRGALADAQYEAAGFSTLDTMEPLPDVLLNEVHDTRGAEHKTLAAALSFLVRGGIACTAGGVLVPEDLLEEAESRALARINGLVSMASRAINGQLDLLRELESGKLEGLKADVAAGRQQKAIFKEWEQALLQSWQAIGDEQASPYTSLTPPVQVALDKTVRQLYDSVLQEHVQAIEEQIMKQAEESVEPSPTDPSAAAIETETPPKVEETTIPPPDATEVPEKPEDENAGGNSSASGDEKGQAERPRPDMLLVLSGEYPDRCRATLSIAGAAESIDQELPVDDPEAAADVLFTRMEPYLATLRENALVRSRDSRGWFGLRRRQGPAISVHIVVESNAVRHRMSLLLKRRIEDALASPPSGGKQVEPVAIDWQAGLSE